MASATSKTTACGCAFCAAEMAGELIRNQSEKLPVEGACPRLWCRPMKPRYAQNQGIKKELVTFITSSNYLLMAERVGFEPT